MIMNEPKIFLRASLLIPTYNAGELWPKVLKAIDEQNFTFHHKLIVDSGSNDATVSLALDSGFEVIQIPQSEFNHGQTRQLLIENAAGSDIGIFITQDAILASPDSIAQLVAAFHDPSVGLAYGRQLPHEQARPLEIHARLFNYPAQSAVRSFADKSQLGFKVFFCSNSFAAYRISALQQAGGFPSESIMGEDAIISARLLLENYRIAYVAEAAVYHSHSYTYSQEFKRYFDTRVFHEQNHWLIEKYGKPTGEGLRYIRSEVRYIMERHPFSLPRVFGSTLAKWLGYSLGKFYRKIPKSLLKKISMHSAYWK
jgi:rhamnosyltransferase